ncbi:LCP family protein [Nocardia inohanensis]|uniref:LCP family protein n=1 Tax=Nocardia inohanensis TaxID=209246 RepID=UPI000A812FD3|nr:LCP family protein [Nocardia inohanensis]
MYDDKTEPIPAIRDTGGKSRRSAAPTSGRSRRERPANGRRRAGHRKAGTPGSGKPGNLWLRNTGRGVMAVIAVCVLGITGVVWWGETSAESGFVRTNVIPDEDRSLAGDINLLIIGLDTRKDLNGNDLPKDILDQLHAGDGSEGGYNANSLILMHIPKDMKKIVAFSIPRDDYVAVTGIPGYDHAKIKETYGLKKYYTEEKLKAKGVTDKVELERQGREAGRDSVRSAVKTLTGVPINQFAEVSLVGFYDLAKVLGGVDVCLNSAVDDSYFSGAVFPAGRQHLDASNALAFVRQRHGLPNGDLDRTHRQQAFLTSIAKSLKDSGTVTNITRIKELMDAAHRDVVVSDDWDLKSFVTSLGRADSPSIEFRTLPVLRYDNINGQDVNIIDPAAIKKEVQAAFGIKPTATPTTPTTVPTSTLDVVNATGTPGMAAQISKTFGAKGFATGQVSNGTYADGTATAVYYGTGAETDAKQLSDMLGGVPIAASADVELGRVKLVLGTDFVLPDALDPNVAASTAATPTTTTAAKTPATSTSSDVPDSGKPVVTDLGGDIPCVN